MLAKSDWTDQKIEVIIGNLLRAGVLLAASVVALGGLVFLVRHGLDPAAYRVFRGEPNDLRNTAGIVHWALGHRSRGVIQLGLVLLIATPVVRVAFSALAFAAERDWMYVAFTLLVLAILLFSLLGSHP
jgi:uncharacterized membrane protein